MAMAAKLKHVARRFYAIQVQRVAWDHRWVWNLL